MDYIEEKDGDVVYEDNEAMMRYTFEGFTLEQVRKMRQLISQLSPEGKETFKGLIEEGYYKLACGVAEERQ
jgi:hypothetical protein